MKKYVAWTRWYFITMLFCALAMTAFNVIVDFNGVFGLISKKGFNEHKTAYLSDRILKFYYAKRYKPESLIMGTSRNAHISPDDLRKYTNDRAFNFALFGSGINEQYSHFRYLARTYPIKTLVIGLDFAAFLHGVPELSEMPMQRYFDEDRFKSFPYLKDYLHSAFTISALQYNHQTIKDNRSMESELATSMDENKGVWYWWKPKTRNEDIIKHGFLLTLRFYAGNVFAIAMKHPDIARKNLEYLRKILAVAKEKNIECRVMVNPINGALYELMYASGIGEIYEDWKKQVAQITDYYDFTGHNSITDDDSYWVDPSHAFTDVGTLMLARIYGDDKVAVPADFGVLVTKQNVEKHMEALHKNLKHRSLEDILQRKKPK